MKYLSLSVLFGIFGVGLGCSPGWVGNGTQCYHFSREAETWDSSLSMCERMNGYLVRIESAAENDFLKSEARLLGKSYWIALSDVEVEGVYVWYSGKKEQLTSESFTDWYAGEPNNHGAGEDCVDIYSAHQYQWHDYLCKNAVNYICEREASPGEIVG